MAYLNVMRFVPSKLSQVPETAPFDSPGAASELRDWDIWRQAGGHLYPVEEHGSPAGADVPGGKGLQGLVDDGLSAFAVEPVGHCDAGFARASGTLGAGVEVTESAAAHGGRLAVKSAGHDVMTFVDHEVLSCG
jgi:hypothetical protein